MITNYSVFLTIMITNQLKKSNYPKKDKEETLQKKNQPWEQNRDFKVSKWSHGPSYHCEKTQNPKPLTGKTETFGYKKTVKTKVLRKELEMKDQWNHGDKKKKVGFRNPSLSPSLCLSLSTLCLCKANWKRDWAKLVFTVLYKTSRF